MNNHFEKLFHDFIKKASATEEDARHACNVLNFQLPPDYLAVLHFSNGGEGFIQNSYVRLYSIDELLSLNEAYQVKRFCPGLILFGSNGSGEAFGFDTRQDPLEIVQIPFIPMDFEYARSLGKSFLEFLRALATGVGKDGNSPQIEMSAIGKEVHQIQPIIFGGSPTDPENRALIASEAHAELSVFWNNVYQEKRYGHRK
jgi:hypothetical protein